jgi:hypothetical protein
MDGMDVSGDDGKRMEETMTTEFGDIHGTRNGKASASSETHDSGATTLLEQPTLVLGATGKTGRRVAERLTARGLPVRIGSRSGSRRSLGRTARPGRARLSASGRLTSPTTPTWRYPAQRRLSARSPSWP